MVTHDQSEAMAMSDRILLLNNGVIEQQGTPEQMYGAPETLFTAEFMGSNNRINGKIAEVRDGMARLVDETGGWSLWGVARGDLKPGASAHGVIRLEQVRVGVDNADNTIHLPLATRMYLGDRWECLFRATDDSGATGTGLRAYSASAPSDGKYALTFPREQFWLYAA
jgi:iron(III) transport system ATP-binding protein